ncbi:MAG: tetratricopeptide repeat protein [Paludibacteraceae bacterium]|nr:tetratricopeptide repeat protein [Paludibacteraceae bacterium]
MKRHIIYILLLCAYATMHTACSTQKNTWASRSFHQTKTKYNIYYNGNISFAEGEDAIREANEDDYSTVLNLYPVSNHEAAKAATSQMDGTIEKCRKCIKLHSIKARPKVNQEKRRKDPEYKAWLEQEEFNNQMGKAWLLLGKAEFHKGDFLGSISTFNYIARHYAYDKDIVAQCQLWSARAYAELGWLYEAEDVLRKVQVDHLSKNSAPLYSAVSADILLKTKQYDAAIPFVKIAVKNEDRRGNRPRFYYVLGQLYQMQGDKSAARNAYKRVLDLQPDNEMEFNARLQQSQLEDDIQKSINILQKMAQLDKHKNRLDQIYGTIGDIYLEHEDTTKALEYYEKGIESSTENGINKAVVLVNAGDIYYKQRDYVKASPCYKEATQILSVENEQYARIQRRSETLDELVVEHNIVVLQDSLQRLAALSEEEQLKVVEKIIADLIQAEKDEAERLAQAERAAENDNGPRSVNTQNMLGGGGSGAWYFYNPQLMRSGKQTFRTQWGNRILEDNWRRLSKASTSSSFMATEEEIPEDSITNEETISKAEQTAEIDDHKPAFYLQQIPKTAEDIERSNQQIADALYNMVYIYRDRVGDQALSDATFQEYCRRFPTNERLVELYYMQYLTALKNQNKADAEQYRKAIIQQFPESKEATIVSQPDYFERLKKMSAEQDSLYENTYYNYQNNNFAAVKANKQYAEEHYPLTPLMPRFLFLNAIAVAKTEGQEAFTQELQDMVTRYPDNELTAMAKDMIALMGQGAESQASIGTSLQDRRAVETTENIEEGDSVLAFSTETNMASIVLMIVPNDEKILNTLLYQVALYNFSQFMIKDFDLKQIPLFSQGQSALQVSGFDTLEEAKWYQKMLQKNNEFMNWLNSNQGQIIPITEENATKLGALSIEEYLKVVGR